VVLHEYLLSILIDFGLRQLEHFDTQHQFERYNFFIDRWNIENLDISPDKFLNKENMTILML
jgi:hypothetical protein